MRVPTRNPLNGWRRAPAEPTLLAITPPRTGERTLLGVENLLGSIAVPEPFSLELASGPSGVGLMVRCLGSEAVRGQIAAYYPQARVRELAAAADPLAIGPGEQAWTLGLRASGRTTSRCAHSPTATCSIRAPTRCSPWSGRSRMCDRTSAWWHGSSCARSGPPGRGRTWAGSPSGRASRPRRRPRRGWRGRAVSTRWP